MAVKHAVKASAARVRGAFFDFYKSKPKEHARLKSLLGFAMGILLTVGVHFVVINTLSQSAQTHQLIVVTVGTWLCIGGSISSQVRCFMLLLVPIFFGRVGRSILLTLAFSLVIKGPVMNFSNNMEEIVRVFSCTGNIAVNLTTARLELMFHPVQDVMRALKVAAYDMQGQLNSFSDALYPLIIAIEDDSRVVAERNSLKAIRGMTEILERLDKRARSVFQDGDNNATSERASLKLSARLNSHCLKMMSIPLNVCNTIDDKISPYFTKLGLEYEGSCPPEITGFCDDVMEVTEQFDVHYEQFKSAIKKFEEPFDIYLSHFMDKLGTVDIGSLVHLKERVEDELSYRMQMLKLISSLLNHTVIFLLVAIFYSADRYQRRYLTDLEFDNCYITWYFRKIDARREEKGKNHLLPLSFLEKTELIPPTRFKMLPSEKRYMVGFLKLSLALILPHIVVGLVIFLVDYFIVYSIELVGRHAQMDIRSQGEHKLEVVVSGTSFLAEQLRNFLSDIRSHHTLDVEISNQECLPRPTKIGYVPPVVVASIYAAVLLQTQLEAYCRRFRSVFCALCHYKQEKRRILWLYNTSLRKRIGWITYRARTVQKLVEQNSLKRDANLLLALRDSHPAWFGWLRKFRCAKRKCVVCDTYEDDRFSLCLDCRHAYCVNCWRFVERSCIACKPWRDQGQPEEGVSEQQSATEVLNEETSLLDDV